jgi:large-conductance mechanosensitive channel
MFVGHYAVGFLLKKKFNEIPLWVFFIAVQFVDILAFTLVLLNVEKMSYNPTANPFLRTSVDYVPFTHSLSSSLIIAFIVFLVIWKLKSNTWGIALSIGRVSQVCR